MICFCNQGPTSSSSTETSEFDLRILKPILNEAEGLYQIGPVDKCSEHFVISVTIAFATNLPQVRVSTLSGEKKREKKEKRIEQL